MNYIKHLENNFKNIILNKNMSDKTLLKTALELKEVFNLFDKESDGTINKEELTNISRCLFKHDCTEEEITNLMKLMDVDGNGKIDFEEFFLVMNKNKDIQLKKEEVLEAFRFFDIRGDGNIPKPELKFLIDQLGFQMLKENEINELLNEYDLTSGDDFDYKEIMAEFYGEEIQTPLPSQPNQ
jgi:Ca2+-binding EF-hand superfamily protein